MGYALFVLLTTVLLIRPEELFPEMAGLRLFLIVQMLCTAASVSALAERLSPHSLRCHPLTAFLLAYLFMLMFSLIPSGRSGDMGDVSYMCLKNGLYFFLALSTVNTPQRFTGLLTALAVCVGTASGLSILQYHGYIDIPAIEPYHEGHYNPDTGEFIGSIRLKGTGIFADPNDFCLMLLLGTMCCLARASMAQNRAMSLLWVFPIVEFGYALMLTGSRGGLLAVLAGMSGLVMMRVNGRKAVILIPVLIGAGIIAGSLGGRQGNITLDDEDDTSQHRIHLWAEAFQLLFSNPLYLPTGIGCGTIVDECGLVAHNSYVQAFVETGFIGGTIYTCLVFLPLRILFHLRMYARYTNTGRYPGESIMRLNPFVFGILLGYGASCYSLTRNHAESTYLIFGLIACYLALTARVLPGWYFLSSNFIVRCIKIGGIAIVFLKSFTMLFGKY